MFVGTGLREEPAPQEGFPCGSDGKDTAFSAGDPGSIPGSGRSWRRKWQPTPVFLPGESHGERSLVGYNPWGHKESDTTERLHFHFHNRFKFPDCSWGKG